MGLIDVLLGRRKLAGPAPDRLFAISTAYVTMQTALGMSSRQAAAIIFQPLNTADFEGIVRDMEEVVRGVAGDGGTSIRSIDDAFGFRWLTFAGADFDELVVGVNAVSSAIESGGYGERLLCAVFGFADTRSRPLYWIYNYKRGTFYPFVPEPGSAQQRDNEAELRLRAQIGAELPVEAELERWLPLWGIPI